MAFAFWRSTLLLAADGIGLFPLLAHTPSDTAAIAEHLGLCPMEAGDFLEALATLGLVECREGVHVNTPLAEQFLLPDKPAYMGRGLAMARAAHCASNLFAERLYAIAASRAVCPTLKARMWSDIAAILNQTDTDRLP